MLLLFCGESGIRTRGTLLEYTHFPGVLLKPLGHLSKMPYPTPLLSKNQLTKLHKISILQQNNCIFIEIIFQLLET